MEQEVHIRKTDSKATEIVQSKKKHQVLASWLYYVAIWAFIILYGYTSIDKLANIDSFVNALHAQVFPEIMVIPLSWGIPILEAVIFGGLLIPRTQWFALWCATGLMLLFTVYTGLGAVDGFAATPCGCAGIFRSFSWAEHFWFNLCFLLGGLAAIISQGWKPKLQAAVPVFIIFSLGYGCSQKAQQHFRQTSFYRIQGEFHLRIDRPAESPGRTGLPQFLETKEGSPGGGSQ